MYLHVIWIVNTYPYVLFRIRQLFQARLSPAQVDPSVKDAFDAPARRFGWCRGKLDFENGSIIEVWSNFIATSHDPPKGSV